MKKFRLLKKCPSFERYLCLTCKTTIAIGKENIDKKTIVCEKCGAKEIKDEGKK